MLSHLRRSHVRRSADRSWGFDLPVMTSTLRRGLAYNMFHKPIHHTGSKKLKLKSINATLRSYEDTPGLVSISFLKDAFSYVAKYQSVEQFDKIINVVNGLKGLSREDTRSLKVFAVYEALHFRPLSQAMAFWTHTARKGCVLRRLELATIAQILRSDSNNAEKQRIARTIQFWRLHENFVSHPDIAPYELLDNSSNVNQLISLERFMKLADPSSNQYVPLVDSQRDEFLKMLKSVISDLKGSDARPVNDVNFPSEHFSNLREHFPGILKETLGNLMAAGASTDSLAIFSASLHGLSRDVQIDIASHLIRRFINQPGISLNSAVPIDVQFHSLDAELFMNEVMDVLGGNLSELERAQLTASRIDNLSRTFMPHVTHDQSATAAPSSSLSKMVAHADVKEEVIRVASGILRRYCTRQLDDDTLSHNAENHAQLLKDMAEGAKLLIASCISAMEGAASEKYVGAAARLIIAARNEYLVVSIRKPNSASDASTSDKRLSHPIVPTISTYTSMLRFANKVVKNYERMRVLVEDGLDVYVESTSKSTSESEIYENLNGIDDLEFYSVTEPPEVRPRRKGLLLPSVDSILFGQETVPPESLQYIKVMITVGNRLKYHPEIMVHWLSTLRKDPEYAREVLPLSITDYGEFFRNLAFSVQPIFHSQHLERLIQHFEDNPSSEPSPTEVLVEDHERLIARNASFAKALISQPELVAEKLISDLMEDGLPVTAAELSQLLHLFTPFAVGVIDQYNARLHEENIDESSGNQILVEAFKEVIIGRITTFLSSYADKNNVHVNFYLLHDAIVKQIVMLYCKVGLAEAAEKYLRDLERARRFFVPSMYEDIFWSYASESPERNSDYRLENLSMLLLSRKYKGVDSSKFTSKMVDARVLAEALARRHSNALDLSIELYNQLTVPPSVNILQILYICALHVGNRNEMGRIKDAIRYMHPHEDVTSVLDSRTDSGMLSAQKWLNERIELEREALETTGTDEELFYTKMERASEMADDDKPTSFFSLKSIGLDWFQGGK